MEKQDAPETKQKKRTAVDAFELMMKSSSPAKKKKHKKLSAFDVMMQTAKHDPGVFRAPVDVKALQKNHVLSDIVRKVLLKKEESQSENKRDSSDGEEKDPGVRANMELLSCTEYYYSDSSESETYSDIESESEVHSEANESDPQQPPPALKPPPSVPSPNAALRTVMVHFEPLDDGAKIVGFTLFYSDGVEVALGEVRATDERVLELQEGEHIVGVLPRHRCSRPRFVDRVYFRTTRGEWLCGVRSFKESGRARSISCSTHGEMKTDDGTVLRSIDWCTKSLTIKGLETVLLADVAIPSLESLAYNKHTSNVRTKTLEMEKEARRRLIRLRNDARREITDAYEEQQRKLQNSPEAAMVRQLSSLLDQAEDKLSMLANRFLKIAKTKEKAVSASLSENQREVDSDLERRRSALLQDHRSFMEYCDILNGSEETSVVPSMCLSSSCRTVYEPNKLSLRNRCSIQGCRSAYLDCGCGIEKCETCHTWLCQRHVREHRPSCNESAPKRCGYNNLRGSLSPTCCNRVIDEDEFDGARAVRCFHCSTRCCSHCSDMCRCGSVWCRDCRHPCALVSSRCCVDSPFYNDGGGRLWT